MADVTADIGFTEADIQRAAGPKSFGRGMDYVSDVDDLEFSGSRITATVQGNDRYRVTLTAANERLAGTCTCPHGQEGFFCKHCAAVGLAVLKLGDDLASHVEVGQAREAALRAWLESLPQKELVDLILTEPELRRRLELRVAAEHADADAIRSAVRELVEVTAYIGYDQAWDYAGDVNEAAEAIGSLVDAGGTAQAIAIAREAIALVAAAFESVDDSSGVIGESAHRLLAAHLRACQAAPPEPVDLAGYLAGLLLNDQYGFAPDLTDYVGLLGDAGTARVRERIAAAYADDPHHYRARALMEGVHRAAGDIDALVAMYADELDDHGRAHLRIVRTLDEAGRHGDALDWAERGLRDATRADDQLADYIADRYAADGRAGDVLRLRRSQFEANRTLARYRALRRAATGCGRWDEERAKALARLEKDAAVGGFASWSVIGPVLVDALLDDGDLDAAWTAVTSGAAKYTVSDAQRLRLADGVAAVRPADALPVYLAAIEPLRKMTGDQAYQRMARLLLSVRGCHERLGTVADFGRYLTALRADQKRKRNLIGILDANGL